MNQAIVWAYWQDEPKWVFAEKFEPQSDGSGHATGHGFTYMPVTTSEVAPKLSEGDVITCRAWWLKNETCLCRVAHLWNTTLDFLDVAPLTGNPHHRTIRPARDGVFEFSITKESP